MNKRVLIWILANVSWIVGLPIVYGIYLYNEVQYQYENGLRTSTDGDSISIPIFGVAIINLALVVIVNLVIIVYFYVKKRKA